MKTSTIEISLKHTKKFPNTIKYSGIFILSDLYLALADLVMIYGITLKNSPKMAPIMTDCIGLKSIFVRAEAIKPIIIVNKIAHTVVTT